MLNIDISFLGMDHFNFQSPNANGTISQIFWYFYVSMLDMVNFLKLALSTVGQTFGALNFLYLLYQYLNGVAFLTINLLNKY